MQYGLLKDVWENQNIASIKQSYVHVGIENMTWFQ